MTTTSTARERSILLDAHDVRAILEGRATQVRRILIDQPNNDPAKHYPIEPYKTSLGEWNWVLAVTGMGTGDPFPCPYGVAGSRLWVREVFALQTCAEGEAPPFDDGRPLLHRPADDVDCLQPLWTQPHYRATDLAPDLTCERDECAQCRDHDMGPHWQSSARMPRWASRISLEITEVRLQRLREIEMADVRETEAGMWADNPWMWVIDFRRVEDR